MARGFAFVLILAILSLPGCAPDAPTAPRQAQDGNSKSQVDDQGHQKVTLVSRSLALALGEPSLRQQILQDLRDSPFPQHRIHLDSYLRGSRGQVIARAAANAAGMSMHAFLDLLSVLPVLELAVSAKIDRVEWTGTSDIVVLGTLLTGAERMRFPRLTGFDTEGRAVDVPLTSKARNRVLSVVPAEIDFGPSPETVRVRAPKRSRSTISTPQAEFTTTSCDPNTAIIECSPDASGGSISLGPSYNVGSDCSVTAFLSTPDADGDRIKDMCENRLAEAFQPVLVFHTSEQHAAREPYWIMQVSGNQYAIMYLLSYYYDGGAVSHHGDSEFVIVGLRATDYQGGWAVASVTLSAHWGACCWGDMTATLYGGSMEYAGWRPVVYVSKDHHANYETKSRCDQRIGDTCSYNFGSNASVVPAPADRNLGSSAAPFDLDSGYFGPPDCTLSKVSPLSWPHPGVECFFTSSEAGDFGGWSPYEGTTHYSHALRSYGFM